MESKTVRDLMTAEVVTLKEHDSLSVADLVMKLGRIRHMPVVSGGRLVGLISQRDLLHHALSATLDDHSLDHNRALGAIKVSDCMTRDPVTCSPEMTLADAARVMLKNKYGCLPVLVEDELAGILTEADFVAAFARQSI